MLNRFYKDLLLEHLNHYKQMIFLSGPRQVGKTTLALSLKESNPHVLYLNWDTLDEREIILAGGKRITKTLPLDVALNQKPVVIFDELHKYSDWKNFIKGFFDTYKEKLSIIVTGSARLDIYKVGGDSLMGRYFHYRINPLSVGELLEGHRPYENKLFYYPQEIAQRSWGALLQYGGFPDPYLERNQSFFERWQLLRHQQFFKEDIRDLSRIVEVAQMEVLARVIATNTGQIANYTTYARRVRVSDKTIRNWMEILKSLYYCFVLKPWTKNVVRSFVKNPKVYLWDWSLVQDKGQRMENFVASHLLKAIHYWRDFGYGDYGLYFIRDKEKREVDFLISRNNNPWILIEVKNSYKEKLSPSLKHFSRTLGVKHSFQVAGDLEYQGVDIFANKTPTIVSMKEFLSYLP